MVENEITISYDDLMARPRRGLDHPQLRVQLRRRRPHRQRLVDRRRLADLIAEAKPLEGADAILQTSEDGWTCGTPLDVVTDGRDAMLAYAMNGKPLEIEHGFPVRAVVPGLYGYVSATKWVVDMEITRYADFTAFWTGKGWGEMGPVKMSSRIEVPRSGADVRRRRHLRRHRLVAAHRHLGGRGRGRRRRLEPAELAGVPSTDTWVQWKATVEVDEGAHLVRVRATDKDGLVQTSGARDVLPDGATGWHADRLHRRGMTSTSRRPIRRRAGRGRQRRARARRSPPCWPRAGPGSR